MICSLIRNLPDLYVTGRLAAFEARWVKSHITSCAKCAAEAAAWRSLFEGLRSMPVPPAPAGLKAALKAAAAAAALKEETPEPESDGGSLRDTAPSLAFAFGFAVLFVSVSASMFGPGVSNQSGGADAPAIGVSQFISSNSVSGVKP
jgi:anti-sigma factor RsiW